MKASDMRLLTIVLFLCFCRLFLDKTRKLHSAFYKQEPMACFSDVSQNSNPAVFLYRSNTVFELKKFTFQTNQLSGWPCRCKSPNY